MVLARNYSVTENVRLIYLMTAVSSASCLGCSKNQPGSSWLRDPSQPQQTPASWKSSLAKDSSVGCEIADLPLISIIYSNKVRSFYSAFILHPS